MTNTEDTLLTDRQTRFLDWLCTAPSERVPMSQAKYAVANEVDETTLRKWKKKDVFVAEWKKRVDVIQGSPERTQLLLDSLYTKGVAGDVKSAQLYLQATNRISPPTVSVSMDKKTKELTDAELDALIGVLASREKSNRALRVV